MKIYPSFLNYLSSKLLLIAIGLNPRTYKAGRGGGAGEVVVTPSEVFVFAPDVFSNCSFIPCAHFERSLVMVSYYGYEI